MARNPNPGTGASPVSAFVTRTMLTLPEPGLDGRPLLVEIQTIAWEDILAALKRLPGGIPGEAVEEQKLSEGNAESGSKDWSSVIESLNDVTGDYDALLPALKHVVSLAAVSPLFQFPDDPPSPDRVPWRLVSMKNQMGLFTGIIRANGFGGEAAKRVESFRDDERGRSTDSVGDV